MKNFRGSALAAGVGTPESAPHELPRSSLHFYLGFKHRDCLYKFMKNIFHDNAKIDKHIQLFGIYINFFFEQYVFDILRKLFFSRFLIIVNALPSQKSPYVWNPNKNGVSFGEAHEERSQGYRPLPLRQTPGSFSWVWIKIKLLIFWLHLKWQTKR